MIRAAVLGKPIAHSLSPLVHGFIYERLGCEYSYERIELDEMQAREFITTSFSDHRSESEAWTGFSLTMPLKEVGFSLGIAVDQSARAAHSINTITRDGCFNTDISGLRRVLLTERVAAGEVVILGNRATARSTLLALDVLPTLERISVFRRNESADSLLPRESSVPISLHPITQLGTRHLGSDALVISTLPSSAQKDVSERVAGFEGTLVDFSYSPWPSVLAGVVAGRVISGLPLLVAQAIDQARIFSKIVFDEAGMYREVLLSTVKALSTR